MTDIGKIISENIKSRIAVSKTGKGKLTQASLAEHIGIEPGYLSELLNNKPNKRWNIDHINSAAEYLGIEPFVLTTPPAISSILETWVVQKNVDIDLFKRLLAAAVQGK